MRCMLWLHHYEAEFGVRMFCRHQQVDVPEHPAAWFVQYKVAELFIIGNECTLFPQRFTGWWCDTTHDYISHLTFCMG